MAVTEERDPSMVKLEDPSQFNKLKPVEGKKPAKLQKLAFPPSQWSDMDVDDWKAKFRIGGFGSLFIIVFLPTIFAALYFFFIASDQYISEAKFLVRSSDKQQVGGLGALLQTTGLGTAPEETFSVIDFMGSRDGLKAVDEALDYRSMMGADGIDFLGRFPNPLNGDTFEGMYDHYQRHVTALHSASSGISELEVKGFTPSDAQKIASTLLDEGEKLVNRMNQRARDDSLELARQEVALAEQRVLENQLEMKAFRVREGIVDPLAESEQALELITELKGERAKIETELSLTSQVAPDSVKNRMLQEQLSAINKQLGSEQQKLISESGSLVGTYADYEKMALEAEFASKALLTAQANLASARVEAGRKQLYLERIVEPNEPDYSRYPKRFLSVLTVLMTCFLIYAMIWLLYVNAREHKQ
ncbi:capsular polysaccharide transport system permease protein [Roseibium hamelinense]|uniref:Capsular polysaccharide transport system permease protein n=1 Tax=Roseibium hamelinense TaxID=150831 RepID=A0A562T393_9HYPH|nr:hypothetical protein [Roseibium hamelinense]MTI44440.1 hypothetical protein [Roseibium hamelinense]TWI87406.1 capsular polysaccharide transport system permease protein [Roseibium hamelinense]